MNEICPDLETFKDGWVRGFSNHEIVYGGSMLVIALFSAFWSAFFAGLPIGPSVFIGIWIGLPVGLLGFLKINGMSLYEVLTRYVELSDSTYFFISDEDFMEGEMVDESIGGSQESNAGLTCKFGQKKKRRSKAVAKVGPADGADPADSAQRDI